MKKHWNNMVDSSRRGNACGLKTTFLALLAALILIPTGHVQAEEQPPAKAWSLGNDKGGSLYSMNFEGGSVSDLKRLWLNAFTNDNFLVTSSAEGVNLRAFQIRDMKLTELARSVAFLSQGALTVEVVERNVDVPGNIWRIARPSQESFSQKLKMRAVAAPHLFANTETLGRFLEGAETLRRKVADTFAYLEKIDNAMPIMSAQIKVLDAQRVFVLVGTEEGISGLESLIKAAEQAAAEPVKEAKSEK
jgi:hypothetical protein